DIDEVAQGGKMRCERGKKHTDEHTGHSRTVVTDKPFHVTTPRHDDVAGSAPRSNACTTTMNLAHPSLFQCCQLVRDSRNCIMAILEQVKQTIQLRVALGIG